MAEAADAACILVADIDRGGMFAALAGTLLLLEPHERARIRAFVVNKFRGDISLLQPGIDEIAVRLGIPCAGVIPFVHDLELDEETREVFRGQTSIELTPTEFKLLRYLMLNPRRVLSKAQILDRVWNYDFDGNANVVEIYISYLRRKIDSLGPPLIHTVRGVGYTLRPPPE